MNHTIIMTALFYIVCILIVLQSIEDNKKFKEDVEHLHNRITSNAKFDDETQKKIAMNVMALRANIIYFSEELDKENKRVGMIEESIDPKNFRWAKIKQVREAIQAVIKERKYKKAPDVIGLTTIATAVVDHSDKYGVEIPLILSIMTRESAFDPGAVSKSNAKGLMQLMDPTAKEVADDLGVRYYKIFKIRTNVKFGVWYLQKMLDRFHDKELAIRAYNCGPTYTSNMVSGIFRRWPEETVNYIEAVLKWEKKYEEMGL